MNWILETPARAFSASAVTIVAIVAFAFWFTLWMTSIECSARAQQMQVNHTFSIWTGCMIRTPKEGKWVPIGAYRVWE